MVALVRIENETNDEYRLRLKTVSAALKQRLKGFWFHISKSYKLVPTMNKKNKEPMVDPITKKPMRHFVVDKIETYINPRRAAIKADRAMRKHHNHFNKPDQVHNHG